ncbi:MAG: histidine kinase [Spirochaetales bacterium]|nr:histidine kinase [Spirochaetales bacterium]
MQKKTSLVSRITLIFVLTSVISIFSYTLVVLNNTYELSRKQMKNLTKTLSSSVIENTDLILNNMDRASIILLNSQEVRDAIYILQDETQDYFSRKESYNFLMYSAYMSTTTREFFTIAYFGKDGELLASTYPMKNDSNNLYRNAPSIRDNPPSPQSILPPENHTFRFVQLSDPVISIRSMLNPQTGTIGGYIAIFVSASRFADWLESESIPGSYSKIILSDANELISKNTSDFDKDSGNYISSSTSSTYSGWTATIGLPVKDYMTAAFRSKLLALLWPMLLIIGSVYILLRILRRTLHPLTILLSNLDKVRSGDYSHTIKETTGFSDIDIIFSDFNAMTREIDRLINTVYANEILFHKAQLQILKLQISPHFLYNTLQTIEAMGEINDVPDVSEISHLLGKLLRYNLKSNDFVSLEEELDSVRDYLKIQQMRFEDSLHYHFQIDNETNGLMIPKFIIQPVIENCIIHGQRENLQPLLISLSSRLNCNMLTIKLRDNGKGMSLMELHNLQSTLKTCGTDAEDVITSGTHIGLRNVDKRLKTRFGESYGLQIDSQQDEYTEVCYTIPLTAEVPENV